MHTQQKPEQQLLRKAGDDSTGNCRLVRNANTLRVVRQMQLRII
jgi:hypothetical protein